MPRPKLCSCGQIVIGICSKCNPNKTGHRKTTTERGYGWDHRQASERYRQEHPLCECCVATSGVLSARESLQMHHIHKIETHRSLRMDRENWLAVCLECHEQLESDPKRGMEVKRWSVANYEDSINKALGGT